METIPGCQCQGLRAVVKVREQGPLLPQFQKAINLLFELASGYLGHHLCLSVTIGGPALLIKNMKTISTITSSEKNYCVKVPSPGYNSPTQGFTPGLDASFFLVLGSC